MSAVALAALLRGEATLGALAVRRADADDREPILKRQAAAALGEGLAKRVYPKAVWRTAQRQEGGVDFTLPGGAYLEAKMTATGGRVELHATHMVQLQVPGSRLFVVLYNRQAAADAGRGFCLKWGCEDRLEEGRPPGAETFDDWVLVLARTTVAVIDVPGPDAVRWLSTERSYMDRHELSYYALTDTFVRWATQLKPMGEIRTGLHWRAKGATTRPKRAFLPVFVAGEISPYFSLLTRRERIEENVRRNAPGVPF